MSSKGSFTMARYIQSIEARPSAIGGYKNGRKRDCDVISGGFSSLPLMKLGSLIGAGLPWTKYLFLPKREDKFHLKRERKQGDADKGKQKLPIGVLLGSVQRSEVKQALAVPAAVRVLKHGRRSKMRSK